MDAATKKQVKSTVLKILGTVDMQKEKINDNKVRELVSELLDIDLSEFSSKIFVCQIIGDFYLEQRQKQHDAAHGVEEEKKINKRRSDGREYDDDGDLINCRLSQKRKVSIQDDKERTLVPIREYYKKDGKYLARSKGNVQGSTTNYDVKSSYKGEFVRFKWSPSTACLKELEEAIFENWMMESKSFTLKYQDHGGEWVLISTDEDLKTAITLIQNNILRLQVTDL